jgi:spoIIIJ-associated protein
MYDTTSEPNEFVADTRDEAVTKAARFFSVDEAELIIKEPRDVFGLGARAVVVAVPKSASGPRPSRSSEPGRERGERGDRGRGRSRRSGNAGDSGGDRDSSRKPDRERGASGRGAQDDPRPAPRAVESERAEKVEKAEKAEKVENSTGTPVGDLTEIGEYVLGVVERMSIGSFELSESEEGEFIVLELRGGAADALTSGDRRAIGAVQLLANQAAVRADDSAKRVVLDCGGEDEDQQSFLERQAGRAADRALDSGRSVALDPMNGRDRRALHVAVREMERVVTMSVGSGRYRQVVIVPEGAPEYEEALKASQDAEAKAAARDSED